MLRIDKNYNIVEQYQSNGNMSRDGEYMAWYDNGQMYIHCFYSCQELTGEYKKWDRGGDIVEHFFYKWATFPFRSSALAVEDAKEQKIRGPWFDKDSAMEPYK